MKRRPSVSCNGVRVVYSERPGAESDAYRLAERFRELVKKEGFLFDAGLSATWEGL